MGWSGDQATSFSLDVSESRFLHRIVDGTTIRDRSAGPTPGHIREPVLILTRWRMVPEEAARCTLGYLAAYANGVALRNDRLIAIEDDHVVFWYKDHRAHLGPAHDRRDHADATRATTAAAAAVSVTEGRGMTRPLNSFRNRHVPHGDRCPSALRSKMTTSCHPLRGARRSPSGALATRRRDHQHAAVPLTLPNRGTPRRVENP